MKRVSVIAAVTLLTALLAAPGLARAAPAADAATPAAPATRGVTLLEQPAWTTLGDDVAFRLAISGDLGGLEARAIVHSSLTSRTGFDRSIDGERLGSTIGTTGAPASTLPIAPEGGRILTLKLQDPNAPRDASRFRVPMPRGSNTGVFPVEIELRDPQTGERVSSFVTQLVAVVPAADGAPVGEPLSVAWIWKIAANPATDPGGTVRAGFNRAIGNDGRLTRLTSAAARATEVPLTLAPGPETLESWAARAKSDPSAISGLSAMRVAARSNQVLTSPYVQIDVPTLERIGLGDDAALELAQGSISLGQVLSTRLDSRTTNIAPLDAAALARLELSQVDRVVVSPDELAPPDEPPQLTPARPFTLQSGVHQFTAVQTDTGLEDLLGSDAPPALRAARFFAGLSIVAIEAPNQSRGVAVQMPALWSPDSSLLDALIGGLSDNPLLAPVTLDQFFDHVPLDETDNGPVVRTLAPLAPAAPTIDAKKYTDTRDNLNAFSSTVGPNDPAIVSGHRGLLISLTSVWPGAFGRTQSNARLNAINGGISAFANQIETPPSGLTVTLTSRKADLPLSFNNETGRTVVLRIKFDSDKLTFTGPGGSEQILRLAPQNNTKSFPVETRASGTFPLRITVTSADGKLPLRAARYTVRSTFVSGVGIILTIGAGVFLAIWWITHWRRSRRKPVATASLAT